MFCIFIHNIYNLCLLHLWKRWQCEACRGCELSVGSLIYFCDWCLSNHLKHAFTKFYIFLITRNKKVDVILIFKSLYNYLICQEKYILFKLTWMHRGMILIWNHFLFIFEKLWFATALDTTLWHWFAHHLIAVNDSLRVVTSTNRFSILLSKLHNVFSMSAKNQRQLKDVASNLNDQVITNGAIFTIKIDCF